MGYIIVLDQVEASINIHTVTFDEYDENFDELVEDILCSYHTPSMLNWQYAEKINIKILPYNIPSHD